MAAVLWDLCIHCGQSHTRELRQLMVYQTLMIHEAWRCGGNGWQGYNTMFRRLAATVPSTDWEQLNSDSDIHGPTKWKRENLPILLEDGPSEYGLCVGPQKLPGQFAGLGIPVSTGVETRKPGGNSGSGGMSLLPHLQG